MRALEKQGTGCRVRESGRGAEERNEKVVGGGRSSTSCCRFVNGSPAAASLRTASGPKPGGGAPDPLRFQGE